MSNKHLSRKPKNLDTRGRFHGRDGQEVTDMGEAWFYEDSDGLSVYILQGLVGRIPWRTVRAALARKDRKDEERTS